MEYISYIDMILEVQEESFQSIDPYFLKFDEIDYEVKKVSKDSKTLLASANSSLFIFEQIPFTNENFDSIQVELKAREGMIDMIAAVQKSVHILEDAIWVKSEYTRKVTLKDYLNYKSDYRILESVKTHTFLCVDVLIKSLQAIISSIAAAERNHIMIPEISLETVYIEINTQPLHPIFSSGNLGIEVKIDVFSQKTVENQNYLAGLALCLFSALKGKAYTSIDSYLNKVEEQRKKILLNYPYALCDLIDILLQPEVTAEKILFSPMVSTWIYLLKAYEDIPSGHSFCPDALLAGIYLKKKSCRISAALILVSQKKAELLNFLRSKPGKNENVRRIARCLCRYQHWRNNIPLLGLSISVLKVLMQDPDSCLSARPGPWKIFKALCFPVSDEDLIGAICKNYTKTASDIVFHSQGLIDLMAASKHYLAVLPYSKRNTLHYLNGNNPLTSLQKLKVLRAVPITTRRLESKLTFQIISNSVEKNNFESYPKIVITALKILRETIHEGKVAQEHNSTGKCYGNSYKWNSTVLMMYCKKCNKGYMCLVCGSAHQSETHIMSYLPSKNPCKGAGENSELLFKDLFDIPEVPMKFFDSLGKIGEKNEFCSEDSREEISITSFNDTNVIYSNVRHSTLLYYEVEVIDAGFSENVSIGIDGTGVMYSGNTGEIIDNKGKLQGPRFGSGDVVGIGFTSTHFLYFTYNGFNLHLYKECEAAGEIRPLIKIKGRGIRIKILTENFLFLQKTYDICPSTISTQMQTQVHKWITELEDNTHLKTKLQICAEGININTSVPLKPTKLKTSKKKMEACRETCGII